MLDLLCFRFQNLMPRKAEEIESLHKVSQTPLLCLCQTSSKSVNFQCRRASEEKSDQAKNSQPFYVAQLFKSLLKYPPSEDLSGGGIRAPFRLRLLLAGGWLGGRKCPKSEKTRISNFRLFSYLHCSENQLTAPNTILIHCQKDNLT